MYIFYVHTVYCKNTVHEHNHTHDCVYVDLKNPVSFSDENIHILIHSVLVKEEAHSRFMLFIIGGGGGGGNMISDRSSGGDEVMRLIL